ncbi:FAD/NAD(P)-binding protein [Nakamurella deserti]|uniref:FAD/NAD(P)-binding protein n=1 Tax=Nakamurella deserti TaxID=2164074 RepID=UPI000DBE9C2E|nr:FAD/NAD(P)-binding protein [Nakamurella deserti]
MPDVLSRVGVERPRRFGRPTPRVGVVGAGPRATALLERLASSFDALLPGGDLDVVVIEPSELGSGVVWRRDQPHELSMNTFAGEVTLFTDESVLCTGPRRFGPTLYQWCRLTLGADLDLQPLGADGRATFADAPVPAWILADPQLTAELPTVLPWSHPSRRLFGAYAAWCFERVLATLPAGMRVRIVRDTVTAVTPVGPAHRLSLAGGADLEVDALVLSTGWLATGPTAADAALVADLAAAGLPWVPPGSPADQDFSRLAPGEPVIVRGLGMGFFDALALLTLERGGRFEQIPGSLRLRYVPSGREPRLLVGSGRGVPFRSKPRYGALPPRSELRYLRGADVLALPRPVDFTATVYPLVLKDAVDAYYRALARVRPAAFAVAPETLWAALDATDDVRSREWAATVAAAVPDPADRLELDDLVDPARGPFESVEEYREWVRGYLVHDLDEGALGDRSPFKLAAWSIGSARGISATLAAHGGLTPRSYGRFRQFMALGGMLGSGPPAFRSEQLLALIDAGVITLLGPGLELAVEDDELVATSTRIPGARETARGLVDAWMHLPAVSRTEDPLMRSLREQGLVRGYTVGDDETGHRTDRFDTVPGSRLVAADGSTSPTRYLLGIPADGVGPPTGASPLPGTNAPFLREVDSVARSVLTLAADLAARGETRYSA